MAQTPALTGLCVTCKNGLICGLSYRNPTPVLQCNEFEIIEYKSLRASRKRESARRMRDSREDMRKDDRGKYLGLCANCELRDSCCFTKPLSGIWHCNEYQ